jgi:hypothetical protein
VTFINNVAGSSNGNDIYDNSTGASIAYSTASVVNCTTTSSPIRFYGAVENISMDCLLSGDCPSDYFYVSSSGVDFPYCGSQDTLCLSLVFTLFVFLRKIFIFIFFFQPLFLNLRIMSLDCPMKVKQ